MVSALFRNSVQFGIASRQSNIEQSVDSIIAVGQKTEGINAFPYALKEFINSVADLPTIEELVKKSESLAQVLGSAS
jgi:hypothetical protein